MALDSQKQQQQPGLGGQEGPRVESFLGAIDFQKKQLSPLSGGLEYIQLDPNFNPSNSTGGGRGWTDDLTYGTGIVYLGALSLGGVWGLREGLRQAKATTTTSTKLKMNYVLNAVTRRGPFLGNSAAVVVMMYHCVNGLLATGLNRPRDTWSSMASASFTAAVFRSAAGWRAAGIAGLMGAGVAAAWNTIQHRVTFYRRI